MKKTAYILSITVLLSMGVGLVQDLHQLQQGIIRLHVVGASDSVADQSVKLEVRDAVNRFLGQILSDTSSKTEAEAVITQNLPELEQIANQVLCERGSGHRAVISLGEESFPGREYDTFSLPAGVYTSLRIRIGEAAGQNWWCVVFPSLCMSENPEQFLDIAAGAGFSDSLTSTLTEDSEYEIRFFFLDLLGQLQNFFHGS